MEMPGIETIQEIDFKAALSVWPDPIPDFGDSVIASVRMTRKGCTIVTFDRSFAAILKALGLAPFQFE